MSAFLPVPPAERRGRGPWRFLEWTLQADVAPDRPPVRHRFRCAGEYEDGQPCEEEGPVCDDFAEAQRWAYRHLKVHQDHRSYEHVAVTPWLMVPAEEPSL
ncbi:hypothetical protein [Kitasatospora sp. NPDC092286]|uniref:DUF7848 domain-containing protein n=2 Tax=unclassified Kitasatospora TaxID=2633591 RepID=UPI003816B1D5